MCRAPLNRQALQTFLTRTQPDALAIIGPLTTPRGWSRSASVSSCSPGLRRVRVRLSFGRMHFALIGSGHLGAGFAFKLLRR